MLTNQLAITPYLTFKIKRHEILFGPDFYSFKKNIVIGAQAGYRYHFLKENKLSHFFIDANFQYVAFISGDGIKRYDDTRDSLERIAKLNGLTYERQVFEDEVKKHTDIVEKPLAAEEKPAN